MKIQFIPISFFMAMLVSCLSSYLGCGSNGYTIGDSNPSDNNVFQQGDTNGNNGNGNNNNGNNNNGNNNNGNNNNGNSNANPGNDECTTITYTKAIKAILDTHCTGCHGAGDTYDVSQYTSAKKNASAVKRVVQNGTMPPASGAPLSADKKNNIYKWVECNTPE
jgi:hypothetical protein